MQRRIENKGLISTASTKKKRGNNKARTCQQPESTSRTYPGVPSSDRAMTHEFCDSSCQTLHTSMCEFWDVSHQIIHSKDESNLDSPSSQSEFVASKCRAEVADRILERAPCTIMTTTKPSRQPTPKKTALEAKAVLFLEMSLPSE